MDFTLLKIISKLLMDISLLPRDCLNLLKNLICIANWSSRSMIQEKDGNLENKSQSTQKELQFLFLLCLEAHNLRREALLSIGILQWLEILQIHLEGLDL